MLLEFLGTLSAYDFCEVVTCTGFDMAILALSLDLLLLVSPLVVFTPVDCVFACGRLEPDT